MNLKEARKEFDMASFHDELRVLSNFQGWDVQISEWQNWKEQEQIPFPSILQTASSYEDLADRVFNWIKINEDQIDIQDVSHLNKLSALFARHLSPLDERIDKMDEFTQLTSERKRFDRLLSTAPDREQMLKFAQINKIGARELSDELGKSDWLSIIETYKSPEDTDSLPYDALKAFQDELITRDQYLTALIGWAVLKDHSEVPIYSIQIFNGEKIKKFAMHCIASTTNFTNEKLRLFFKKMQKVPASEKAFFFYQLKPNEISTKLTREEIDAKMKNGTYNLAESLYSMEFNVFNQVEFGKDNKFGISEGVYAMAPSYSMMQFFLRVHGGANCVTSRPCLDISSLKQIAEDIKLAKRVMTIFSPNVKVPLTADGAFVRERLDFTRHDLYHPWITSYIPHHFQLAFDAVANAILVLEKEIEHPLAQKLLLLFHEGIADMEHTPFRFAKPDSNMSELFFLSIERRLKTSKMRIVNDMRAYRKEESKELLNFEFEVMLRKEKIMEKLANILQKQNLCETYQISDGDLRLMNNRIDKEIIAAVSRLTEIRESPALFEDSGKWTKKVIFKNKKEMYIDACVDLARTMHERDLASKLIELRPN